MSTLTKCNVNDLRPAYHGPWISSSSLLLSLCPQWNLRCCCVGHKNSTSLSGLRLEIEGYKREMRQEVYNKQSLKIDIFAVLIDVPDRV